MKTKPEDSPRISFVVTSRNDDHGGERPLVGPDPRNLPDGLMSGGPFEIGGYTYEAGDFRLPGSLGRPPVIKKGAITGVLHLLDF